MKSSVATLVDGESCASISTLDRGLLYGDGVFETLAVTAGRPHCWRRHIARLHAGCERLGITAPAESVLLEEAAQLLEDADRCVLKIIVTRGSGGRGYAVPQSQHATHILQRHDWPTFPKNSREQGVRTRLCTLRLGRNPALAGIKHLNRLEQVLARAEWDDAEIREGLMLDSESNIIEGTMSNLFLVMEDVLITPDLSHCGVAGIMRSVLLEQGEKLGLDCRVCDVSPPMLAAADEVFLCNSLIGVWPVIAVDARPYKRGEITARLQACADDRDKDAAGWLDPVVPE